MAEETAVEATQAAPTAAAVEVTPAPVTGTPTIEDMAAELKALREEHTTLKAELAKAQTKHQGAQAAVKAVANSKNAEIATLKAQVQQLQRQVTTLELDNKRLHDANVDMLDKLSKADTPETTILPPHVGGYLRIGSLDTDGFSGVLWLERSKDEKPHTFTEVIVAQEEPAPSGALAALSTRQQWAVRQNAEVIKTIFETMNQRSLARIAEQEKPQ